MTPEGQACCDSPRPRWNDRSSGGGTEGPCAVVLATIRETNRGEARGDTALATVKGGGGGTPYRRPGRCSDAATPGGPGGAAAAEAGTGIQAVRLLIRGEAATNCTEGVGAWRCGEPKNVFGGTGSGSAAACTRADTGGCCTSCLETTDAVRAPAARSTGGGDSGRTGSAPLLTRHVHCGGISKEPPGPELRRTTGDDAGGPL